MNHRKGGDKTKKKHTRTKYSITENNGLTKKECTFRYKHDT